MLADELPFVVTLWRGVTSSIGGVRVVTTWGAWASDARFTAPPVVAKKNMGRGWSPVTFAGDHRKKANAESAYAIALDFEPAYDDDGTLLYQGTTVEQASALFPDLAWMLHTSWGHQIPEKDGKPIAPGPRLRLVLPLSRQVTPEEYPLVWEWAARVGRSAGFLDEGCKDISRFWFVPMVHPQASTLAGASYIHRVNSGDPIDVDSVVAVMREEAARQALPPRPRSSPPAAPARGARQGKPAAKGTRARQAYVDAALARASANIRGASKGTRNNVLNKEAYGLAGFVGSGELSEDAVHRALLDAARSSGWDNEELTLHTLHSGLIAGAQAPRYAPDAERAETALGGGAVAGATATAAGAPPAEPPAVDAGVATGGSDGGGGDPRPLIRIDNADRHRMLREVVRAMATTANANVFQRSGQLVFVTKDPHRKVRGQVQYQGPTIRDFSKATVAAWMDQWIRWEKFDRDEDEWRPASAPTWLIDRVHGVGSWEEILPLTGIVQAPVMRPDGTVFSQAGYDEESGLVHMPTGPYDPIPDAPSFEDCRGALAKLLDLVKDFPFEAPAHRSAWLASLLSPLARPMIEGPCPMFLVDANVRGAGKGLLLNLTATIFSGKDMPKSAYVKADEEMEKRILGVALTGQQMVCIDDITGNFGCPSLNNALTSTWYEGRFLGQSKIMTLPLTAVWYGSGNNVQLNRDIARRIIPIRLSSRRERPEQRTDLTERRLLQYVRKNRRELHAAALTLVRGWVAAGSPVADIAAMGSFEEWSDVVRQVIVWLGMPDPIEAQRSLDSSDIEMNFLGDIIDGWAQLEGDMGLTRVGITANEVLRKLDAVPGSYHGLRDAIAQFCPTSTGRMPTAYQLGRALTHIRNRVIGGRAMTRVAGRQNSGICWTVEDVTLEPATADTTPPPAAEPQAPATSAPAQAAGSAPYTPRGADSEPALPPIVEDDADERAALRGDG